MLRTVVAVAAIAIGVTAVVAQSDPIASRKALMKEVGAQTKTGGGMAKGELPYDQAKAQGILAVYVDAATKLTTLYPENSKTGGDTAAKPEIWENIEDFKARLVKLGTDAKAALDSVTDLDTFKAAFGNIGKNDCAGCHEKYRVKKS